MAIEVNIIKQILPLIATKHQGILENQLVELLSVREKGVFCWLFDQYKDENKRRWYDPFHILFSTNFALKLVAEENLDRSLIPAIILHDVGYFALTDKSQWSSKESRITHMQEGVPVAARVLMENHYSATEIESILGMISVHDNPYIGLPIYGKDRLGMRDCDRIWVMHILSFYKDFSSKVEGDNFLKEFLLDRLTQFFGESNSFGDEWIISPERLTKNFPKFEPPTFSYTRNYIERQFQARIKEFDENILQSETTFTKYLESRLLKE